MLRFKSTYVKRSVNNLLSNNYERELKSYSQLGKTAKLVTDRYIRNLVKPHDEIYLKARGISLTFGLIPWSEKNLLENAKITYNSNVESGIE